MMFRGKHIFNASFETYAGEYHSARPGYPDVLFADIWSQGTFGPASKILEIGAGSGIATKNLAKSGSHVVALEPGEKLAAIAAEQVRDAANVKVVRTTFEEYETNQQFDAVMAFTAFHWLNEGAKYQRIADLLNDSGLLVLVWNSFFQSDAEATRAVNTAYREFLPAVYPEEEAIEQVNAGVLSKLNGRERDVVSNPLFYPILLKKYLVTYQYDHEMYAKLLNTFPKVIQTEDAVRQRFLTRISEIVKQYGAISVPILSTLIICRKRAAFLQEVSKS